MINGVEENSDNNNENNSSNNSNNIITHVMYKRYSEIYQITKTDLKSTSRTVKVK
jgi:hypothetical protein